MKLLGNFTPEGLLYCSDDGIYTVQNEISFLFKYTRSVKFNCFFIDYSSSLPLKGELFYALNGDVCSDIFELPEGKDQSFSFYIRAAVSGDSAIEPFKLTLQSDENKICEMSVNAVAVDLRE